MRRLLPYALVLIFCGRGEGFAAGADSLEDAWREVEFLNFDRAIPIFEAWSSQEGAVGRQAKAGLALSLQYRQPDREFDKRQALQIYEGLLEAIPERPTAPGDRLVLYLRARMAENVDFPGDLPDVEAATQMYERLIMDSNQDFLSELAATHLVAIRLRSKDSEILIREAQQGKESLEWNSNSSLAGARWMLLGNALNRDSSKTTLAAEAYEKALFSGLAAENLIPSVHWRIARIAETHGDSSRAVRHYEILRKEHERSLFADESSRGLERLGKQETPSVSPLAEP